MIDVIDKSKCTGCGMCFKSCSLDVFRIDTHQQKISPCMAACPAGTDIRGYNSLIQQGLLQEAASRLCEKNPFPAITGRVCFRPCENDCSRKKVDEAVNINGLEQYLGDMWLEEEKSSVQHIEKVAVVGSGPAGLSCAVFLARMGYPVTVFEAMPEPGGMLRYGIPAYRLPDAVVEKQIAIIAALGVQFQCGTRIGEDGNISIPELFDRGFRAVMLAPGASLSHKLDLEGCSLPGVFWGVEFLQSVRMGNEPQLHGQTIVIGGGNVAIDAAITAKRLGASQVTLVSLETEAELPAFLHNQKDAHTENVHFECGWGPVSIHGKQKVDSITIKRCMSVRNENGEFHPIFDAAQQKTLSADAVIFAIGQKLDVPAFSRNVSISPKHTIAADGITYQTSSMDIFAAGDAVTGPSSVIQAITGGREAALSIDRKLRGCHLFARRFVTPEVTDKLPQAGIPPIPRNNRKQYLSKGFAEQRRGLDCHGALAEGMRCLTCGAKAVIAYDDDCMTCYSCELSCPSGAVLVHPFKEVLPRTLEMQHERSSHE